MLTNNIVPIDLENRKINLSNDNPDNLYNGATKLNIALDMIQSKLSEVDSTTIAFDKRMLDSQRNQVDMAIELETVKNATLTGVDSNIFIETLKTLQDVNLVSGYFDSANGKIIIK